MLSPRMRGLQMHNMESMPRGDPQLNVGGLQPVFESRIDEASLKGKLKFRVLV